ncbi:MAG: hypothetical protein ACHQD8_02750 [Chitinophagales bacterium]
MKNIILSILFASSLITIDVSAKVTGADTTVKIITPPLKKFYVGSGMDGAIFSTATIQHTNPVCATCQGMTTTNTTGTLRFSWFINAGLTFNFNLSKHFGIYTGIDIKNIGYIEQANGWTVKRRTYNIGVPVGIKIGNMMPKRTYMFIGGGVDAPINFKDKKFQVRNEKTKFNEWFSQRTPAIMPYIFAGMSVYHGITVKAQYYLNNFLNPDFIDKNGTKPYAGTEVHLILLSIGYAVPVSDHHDMVKKSIDELQTK